MFSHHKMISEEQINNLTNELNEMVMEKEARMAIYEKQGQFSTNAQAHVAFDSFNTLSTHTLKAQSSILSLYQETGSSESLFDGFQNGVDFRRRGSAADAEHLKFHGNITKVQRRRASAADAYQHSAFDLGNGDSISSQKEFPNSFQEFWFAENALSENRPFSRVVGSNSAANFSRRASVAVVTERFHSQRFFTNRRASEPFVQVPQPTALLSAAASNEMPRYWHVGPEIPTITRKKHSQQNNGSGEIDKLDKALENICLSIEGKQTNDVLRLFDLMRKLHVYLNDVVPLKQKPFHVFNGQTHNVDAPQPLMPRTKNIRTHVKHIIYQCNNFCHEKSRRLDEYHCADRQKYFECSRAIFVLRKLIKQLETFKTADFEHRKGAFVHSFAAAKAKNLEILLTQMIEKIRECNICIEVYRYSIQQNILETGLTSMEYLEKAVAIAAAMKIEPKNVVNENQQNVHISAGDCWGAVAATIENCKNEQLEKNVEINSNNGGVESIENAAKIDLDSNSGGSGGTRNATRFVGNFI